MVGVEEAVGVVVRSLWELVGGMFLKERLVGRLRDPEEMVVLAE